MAAMRGIAAHGPRQRSEIEREIEARSANFYAGFFLRQLNPDMLVLDCGCGTATITIGLAEALPAGTVIGIDLAKDSLAAARRYASVMGKQNLFCAAADGRQLPFPEAAFDAVLSWACGCYLENEPVKSPAEPMVCGLSPGGRWIRTSSFGASGEADAILPVKDRPR